MTTQNRKSPAPEQASEAAQQRPGMDRPFTEVVPTAKHIVDARAAGGNGTSSKVSRADALTDEQIATLKQAALAATPQDIDSAERIGNRPDGSYLTCPACEGEGCIPFESDYCNYDHIAIGVQFYGVGEGFGKAEAYFRAARPATILALLDRLEHAEAALLAAQQPELRDKVTDDDKLCASRYRWLSRQVVATHSYDELNCRWEIDYVLRGESFDAAIDTARAAAAG
ncbi:hypothetical protein ACGTRS_01220 [Burkholderia semiarida]|uniref:Gp38 n=1 Tax=Burkholderia semiarida TaxID=2843303 RepID=A0ABW7KXG3_9BURK